MPREKSVGAIIFRREDDKIYYLLLHYHSGHWEFSRGHAEHGESEEETAKREIEEETGLKDLKIVPGFRQYTKFFFRRVYGLTGEARKKAPWVFKMVVLYLAQTRTKDIKLSDEHIGYAWFALDDALKKLSKGAKEILKKADDTIRQGSLQNSEQNTQR